MDRIAKNSYSVNNVKRTISIIIFIIVVLLVIVIGGYILKAHGNLSHAAINMMADMVGDDTPITALVLGVSEDLDSTLTDTIMLARI